MLPETGTVVCHFVLPTICGLIETVVQVPDARLGRDWTVKPAAAKGHDKTTLFPETEAVSNFAAMINAITCDHWFYAPAVGILLSLASLLRNKTAQKTAYLFLVAGVIIFSLITISRNKYWKDTETLSRFILRYEPNSAKTWNNLAIALAENGKYQEAIEDYSKAIALEDSYPHSHHNLANAYARLGEYNLAEREYLKAIGMDNRFFYSYLALGKLYLAEGEKEKAADYFRKALEIYPGLSEARELLNKLQLNNFS